MSPPFDTLSEGQKACLRLIARGMSSKEIDQVTNYTWQTVDTYTKQATARLGYANRREAARAFVAWELSQKSESRSPALVDPDVQADEGGATERSGWRRWLHLPPVGGEVNRLSRPQKTLAVFQVATIGATVMIALALVIAGLLNTFR